MSAQQPDPFDEVRDAINTVRDHLDHLIESVGAELAARKARAEGFDAGFAEAVAHCRELHAKGVPPNLWGER